MRHAPRRAIVVLLGSLAPSLAASVATAPLATGPETVGEREVLWVDWGDAGPSRPRDAELIAEEHEGLRLFLRSGEMRARLLALVRLGQAREVELVRESLARWQVAYATVETASALPRQAGLSEDELPLPGWAWGIPPAVRASTQVLLFDDRDPAQRAWVLAEGRAEDRFTYAFATAWRSGQDRDAFWRANPGVSMQPIATDQIATFYGVTAYPARIRFGDETMSVRQGLGP